MKTILCMMIGSLLIMFSINVSGQVKVGNKVKKQTNNRVDQRTGQGINKGLDAVEGGIKGVFKKKDKSKTDEDPEAKTAEQDNNQKENKPESKDHPSLQSYSKFDFVPGDKVIFFEDFSSDAVGDFPALWTTDVAGEINTLNIAPGHWLNLNSGEGTYWFMKDIDFPQNFILEMDIVPKDDARRIAAVLTIFGESTHSEMNKESNPGNYGLHINMEKERWSTSGYKKGMNEKLEGSSVINPVEVGKANHVIIWVQNRRVRIYNKGAKVLDVPTNIYDGSKFNRLCFKLYRGASCASYISNIKITTAAPDMRSKLLTEGKLVSYGIYFDVNKDVVKPESYGTLKGIAEVLKGNPDLRVKIVGHTDSDGADAANLDLSQRRGASVKNELVNDFGVEAARLESDGKGETMPVAPNDTPVNKSLNRRVEFIKL